MAKEYAPKYIQVSLSVEDWLDVSFGMRSARDINLSPEMLEKHHVEERKLLKDLSTRYIRIIESIERQVK